MLKNNISFFVIFFLRSKNIINARVSIFSIIPQPIFLDALNRSSCKYTSILYLISGGLMSDKVIRIFFIHWMLKIYNTIDIANIKNSTFVERTLVINGTIRNRNAE